MLTAGGATSLFFGTTTRKVPIFAYSARVGTLLKPLPFLIPVEIPQIFCPDCERGLIRILTTPTPFWTRSGGPELRVMRLTLAHHVDKMINIWRTFWTM